MKRARTGCVAANGSTVGHASKFAHSVPDAPGGLPAGPSGISAHARTRAAGGGETFLSQAGSGASHWYSLPEARVSSDVQCRPPFLK